MAMACYREEDLAVWEALEHYAQETETARPEGKAAAAPSPVEGQSSDPENPSPKIVVHSGSVKPVARARDNRYQ